MSTMHDAISIPKYYLTLTGQWPVSSPKIIHRVMSSVSFIFALLFSLSMVVECSNQMDDYQVLSELVSILIPPTSLVFKLVVFKMKSRYLLKLMEHLDAKEFNARSTWSDQLMEKAVKFTRLLGNSYQCSAFLVILLYTIRPLVSKIDLPIMFSYDLGRFLIGMYAFQVAGLFNAVASNTCIDVLAASLMGIASAQIDILNSRILNMEYHLIEEQEIIEGNNQKFNECIQLHNHIVRFVETLDDVFSLTILIQYMTSAACICNIGFQLVHTPTDDIIQFAKMIVFFFAMLGQLGLYCWYGNEIIVKSIAIRDACYESNWYNSNLKIRRSLLIVMERSKEPLFLTSGKFYVVSLASFTSVRYKKPVALLDFEVIKTSYSYFALMQTLIGKE